MLLYTMHDLVSLVLTVAGLLLTLVFWASAEKKLYLLRLLRWGLPTAVLTFPISFPYSSDFLHLLVRCLLSFYHVLEFWLRLWAP